MQANTIKFTEQLSKVLKCDSSATHNIIIKILYRTLHDYDT